MIILEDGDRAPARLNEKVSVPVVVIPGNLSAGTLAADVSVLPT